MLFHGMEGKPTYVVFIPTNYSLPSRTPLRLLSVLVIKAILIEVDHLQLEEMETECVW